MTNSLDRLYDELNNHDIIVTPHLDVDYPDDGCMPNDSHIMKSGIFNLGFIGVKKSETVDRFLRWWQNKLYDKCVIDHAAGYFVDQKFIDYAFVLFRNISIIYDTGYNVAYWNLHSRKISLRENKWVCNNGKLYFFHFSDYKPERSLSISGHQNRYQLADLPDLNNLFLLYHNLLEDNGYSETRTWPYTFNTFSNIRELRFILKRFYRLQIRQSFFNPHACPRNILKLFQTLFTLCKNVLILIFKK